jgi:hypothetical protein
VMLPWFDKLIMRAKPLKTRDLILSLSKDEAKISCFFSSPLKVADALRLHSLGLIAFERTVASRPAS